MYSKAYSNLKIDVYYPSVLALTFVSYILPLHANEHKMERIVENETKAFKEKAPMMMKK